VAIFKTFWGSLVMLIALMLVLEHAGGLSKILGASGTFVKSTVGSFKA
jgi:hypothetical protein